MSRLGKFQGFLIDALNQVNAAEYFYTRVTTSTPGYEPPLVKIHYPASGHSDPRKALRLEGVDDEEVFSKKKDEEE